MNTAAIQAPAPRTEAQQAVQPQIQKPSQSFKDVMQAVQQQSQKPQQSTGAQKPQQSQSAQKPQASGGKNQQTEDAQGAAAENTRTVQKQDDTAVEMTGAAQDAALSEVQDGRAQSLRTMFEGLFGAGAAKVDYTQSDEDILKALLNQCQDPEQRFAVMLMMAFLQANPDYTLEDLAGKMPENGPAQTGASPVAAVTNAIMKLMEENDDIQSFPLLNEAKTLLEPGTVPKNLFAELAKAVNLESVTVNQGESTLQQGSPREESDPQAGLLMQGKFQSAVAEAKKNLNGEAKESKFDIEHLQQQVDSGVFLRSASVFTKAAAPVSMPAGPEFVDQVRTGILTNLKNAQTEFIMRLRPEGLGELTVKLAEAAGKMTLTITASSAQTQRLLESQLPSLREVMKPYEVEVSSVVNGKEDAAERFGGAFGQQFGEHGHQAMEQERHGGPAFAWDESGEEADEIPAETYTEAGVINTYI